MADIIALVIIGVLVIGGMIGGVLFLRRIWDYLGRK